MAETTNSSVLDILEVLKQIHLKYFLKCALLDTVPPPMLKLLQNKKMEEERQPFLAKYRQQRKKKRIAMNVMDGKPQFVHRTFAEYFTARWLNRNFKLNRSVLKRIFFTLDIGS